MLSAKKSNIMNTSYRGPIKKIISISTEPMALFTSDLSIVTANAEGKALLRSSKSSYAVIKESLLCMKTMSKKVRFRRKIWVLSSHPIFISEKLADLLVIAKEN